MSNDCGSCGKRLSECECTPQDHEAESQTNTLNDISEKLDKIIELLKK